MPASLFKVASGLDMLRTLRQLIDHIESRKFIDKKASIAKLVTTLGSGLKWSPAASHAFTDTVGAVKAMPKKLWRGHTAPHPSVGATDVSKFSIANKRNAVSGTDELLHTTPIVGEARSYGAGIGLRPGQERALAKGRAPEYHSKLVSQYTTPVDAKFGSNGSVLSNSGQSWERLSKNPTTMFGHAAYEVPLPKDAIPDVTGLLRGVGDNLEFAALSNSPSWARVQRAVARRPQLWDKIRNAPEWAPFLSKTADFSDQINAPAIPMYLAAAGLGTAGLIAAGKKLHSDLNDPNLKNMPRGEWDGLSKHITGRDWKGELMTEAMRKKAWHESGMTKSAVVKQDEETGKWILWTRDKKRKLGTHDTAQEAYAQEYAIQKSKERDSEKEASISTLLRRARNKTHTHPTPAQASAGNYAKGEVAIQGMKIKIENPKDTTRRGYDKEGNQMWSRVMKADYGYFKGTKAVDGDAVDCFIGPDPESEFVVAVDQYRGDTFDETKFVLGVNSQEEGEKLYLAHYPRGWKLGPVSTCTTQQLRAWLKDGAHKKPFAGQQKEAFIQTACGQVGRLLEGREALEALARMPGFIPSPWLLQTLSPRQNPTQPNYAPAYEPTQVKSAAPNPAALLLKLQKAGINVTPEKLTQLQKHLGVIRSAGAMVARDSADSEIRKSMIFGGASFPEAKSLFYGSPTVKAITGGKKSPGLHQTLQDLINHVQPPAAVPAPKPTKLIQGELF